MVKITGFLLAAVVPLLTVAVTVEKSSAQGFPGGPGYYRGMGEGDDYRGGDRDGFRQGGFGGGDRESFGRGWPGGDRGGLRPGGPRGDFRDGESWRGPRGGFGPGGPGSGDWPPGRTFFMGDRSQRYAAFSERLDVNHDGQIDPNELQGPLKGVFEDIARRGGLDPKKVISTTDFREALMNRSGVGGSATSSSDGKASTQKEQEPLVPGFGVEQDLQPVPEFGVRVEKPTQSASGGASSLASAGSSSLLSGTVSPEQKSRDYAKGIVEKYDTDNSGALESNEWEQMRTNPRPADRNNDGVVTADELVAHLMRDNGYQGGSSGSQAFSGSGRLSSQKSYRFLSPLERLPDGLPSWFAGKDANQDGQVAMHEYASSWTDATAHRFGIYDLNNDGVITSDECLEAEKSGLGGGTESAAAAGLNDAVASGGGGGWWQSGPTANSGSAANSESPSGNETKPETKSAGGTSGGGGFWWNR